MEWIHDDGGRSAAGFQGAAGDCVTRSITIATGLPYLEIYGTLFAGARAQPTRGRGSASPRNGVAPKVYKALLAGLGWDWTPTMQIGSGCRVHLRPDELPPGRIIVRLSGHLAAVIDGVLRDTYDCSRDGTRCVYGYWTPPAHA